MTDPARIAEAVEQCWREGDLSYLYYDLQLEWDESFRAKQSRMWVAECSRRIGKSVFCVGKAVEPCIQGVGDVRYAAPTGKMVKNIITPILRSEFLPDCPPELRPKFYQQDGLWAFPTGCNLYIAGVNNDHADDLRGTASARFVIDEGGFIDALGYLVDDVAMPQLLTSDGDMLIASSPATTPAHDFARFCAQAEANGSYVHATIYDALKKGHPRLTPELIESFAAELLGGKASTAWRREYLAQRIIDEESAIVPEFTAAESGIVEDFAIPPYRDCYVVADLGFVDLSFWLLGFYDFMRGVWCVEDELVFRNASVTEMVRAVRAREGELWGDRPPHLRVTDAEGLVIAEMSRELKYACAPARRDDLDAAVNALRHATQHRKYRIHPRCRQLISHMKSGVWNTQRTGFARMGSFGHFDGVAAAMYFERHVSKARNPYPALADGVSAWTHHIPPAQGGSTESKAFRRLGSKWRRPRT